MQMNNSPRRLDAGLVYYFAIALHRRSPRHTAIKEAAHASTALTFMDDRLFRTRKQIQKATKLSIGNAARTVYRLWEMGGLERRDNPKHDFGSKPWLGPGTCQHLYRITEAGRSRKPLAE